MSHVAHFFLCKIAAVEFTDRQASDYTGESALSVCAFFALPSL